MINIIEILDSCKTINEISLKINGYSNGRVNKKIKEYIIKYGYEYKFFSDAETKYNNNPKFCKECSDKIIFEKRVNDFCSSKCSATYNNKLRDAYSDEIKEKISLSLKKYFCDNPKIKNKICSENKIQMVCVICENKFDTQYKFYNGKDKTRKTCSESCNSLLRSKITKDLITKRIKNGLHKGWQSRNIESYPETFFKKVLDNNGIKYEFNKIISKRSLGLDCDSNYFLDFYIIDKNIDLEIDGSQHKLEERIESDDIRNKALIDNGFIVYRIEWKNINTDSGKEYIKNEIEKFLEFIK